MKEKFSWRDYDKYNEWLHNVLETQQDEIERLNKEIEQYKYSADELNEIERLNNIINNAIETIKDEGLVVAMKMTNGEEETLLSSKELLLEILQGSDKE